MRTLTSLLTLPILLGLLAATPAAQSPPPAGSPPSQAESKPAATVVGKWKMTVEVDSGDRTSTLEIKLDGKKVSGTTTAPSGEYPLVGELADGKLSFSMEYQNLKLVFTGALKDDGTLAGTVDWGEGPYIWKAERIKDK